MITAPPIAELRGSPTSARSGTPSTASLLKLVAPYEGADDRTAWWVLATSLLPFIAMWWVMYQSLALPYWVTLLLAFPTAGFAVRTFIIQHDCGHGSFFTSAPLRIFIGRLCSLATFTPYGFFRHFHGAHHATSSKLDKRGTDIETLTVREYLAAPWYKQLQYRLLRTPLILFTIAPVLYFLVGMRFPWLAKSGWGKERRSILLTDVALAVVWGALTYAIGWKAVLMVELPIAVIATTTGMWLFYVQHQFEDTYWANDNEWDYGRAAMEGSSYYALPPVLEWFTGYIGLHHVHHLSPRVPSYRLSACHHENPVLANVPKITLADGIKCLRLRLWDEDARKLVGWRELRGRKSA